MTRPFVVATVGLTATVAFLMGLSVAGFLSPTPAQSATPPDAPGVVVSRVEPLSPGSDAQIDRGHVILEINRRPVRSVDDFRREVADTSPGDVLAFDLFNPDRQQHELRTVRVDN